MDNFTTSEIMKRRKTNDITHQNSYIQNNNYLKRKENKNINLSVKKYGNGKHNYGNANFQLIKQNVKRDANNNSNKNINILKTHTKEENNFTNKNRAVYNNYKSYNNNITQDHKIYDHPFINQETTVDICDDLKNYFKDHDIYKYASVIINSKFSKPPYNVNNNINKIGKNGLTSNEYTKVNVLNEKSMSYEYAIQLNKLWNIYVDELIKITNKHELDLSTINDMELNGAKIEIHKSRCATYIGLKGIILLETQQSFKIITPNNKTLILLKNKSVFSLYIKNKSYYLHGTQLLRDPALKSYKTYKVLQNRAI
ncbi:ribonuclease P protein subunit p29, putative [Hepatocystis sp. ex Piliocolobus tephrosceles]|nr:ribonuclease P protein subunit p29, putative [Hepatocystis sp. ex Piliocolobus tephrosceles]